VNKKIIVFIIGIAAVFFSTVYGEDDSFFNSGLSNSHNTRKNPFEQQLPDPPVEIVEVSDKPDC